MVDLVMEYRLVLLLAVTAGVTAGPAGLRSREETISTCSKTCTGSTKFGYAPGTTYEYKYEGMTRTSMLGASEDHSTIGINARADIEVLSKCELVLQLKDVTIFAYDSKQYADQDKDKQFAQTLERFPLRFSFQDGQIESVCPSEKEKPWAVNIKKGILSSLQNTMDSFDINHKGTESDVTGKCDTEYTIAQRGWRSLSLKKSKDLSTCSHRQGFDSAIQTAPFRVSSGMKSLPIMKSTHTCDQEVSTSGTLLSSVCHEMHTLRPFSKENSGATTEVTQQINFVRETRGTSQDEAACGAPEELFFKHAPSDVETDLSAREALDLLKDLCDTTATEVTPETSRDFGSLVSILKRIDFSGLRRVYNQVNRDSFCRLNQERVRRFYIDAVPMVGTEPAIQLMKILISNDDITGSQADMWLASIAFIHHPTKEMIRHIQELTGLPSLSSKVLLPLSALVQSYCRVNPQCAEVQEVTDFIDILQKNIGRGCKADQKNFNTIMMSLRALGNTGHADMAVPALYDCISEDSNSMDVKVAAIQAFRQLSCATDRNNLMGIYRDTTADSELRIMAYLAVMKCPSAYFISQIQETLASEEVNQVGSFVWSHLTNLMESSDPSNRYVQELLLNAEFDEKFDLDKMKFSRNYEGSFYLEKYNTGAKIDSNMIWSSKSFVPRSATLNLTMNLFGESMNLFEIGGRVEGLESLLESYFGPVGYFSEEGKGSNDIPDADPRFAGLSNKKLKDIRNKAKKTMDELRGAMYMRMFGSELSYTMFGANSGIDDKFSGSEMFDFLKKLRNNEKPELSLTRNVMFLDSTYILPTVVGLPLKLAVNGTATVALNIGGQADVKNPRQRVIIEGNFEPSGSVEVDSMMSVDAVVSRGGLKMVSTLYTSTGARGKIEITGGNVFDLSFDTTKEKNEIVDVKSTFFMVYNDVEKEQKMILDGQEEKFTCTGDRLTEISGIQFCAGYSAPNADSKPDAPYFPFTGPVSFTVTMNKLDLPNGYKLEVKTIRTPVQTLFRFMSDTPGSRNERAVGLDVDVKHTDKTLDINLLSPWMSAAVNGQLIDTASVKGLLGNINIDEGNLVYNLDAKILIDRTKDRVTYTPQIGLDIPDWKNIRLTGGINYKQKISLDADLLITGAQDTPIVIQTSILNTDTEVGVKGKVNYTEGEGYVFEAFSKRKVEHKKLRSRYMYDPRVYIRTPDEEIMELNGNAVLITGKSFKATGALEKLTKIPYKLNVDLSTVEYTKKKRVKSIGRINLTGPRLANKLMILHDNRMDKNIFTKWRWDYSFGKQWKDTLMSNTRVKINNNKFKKNVKVTSTLNSVRNNNLDADLTASYVATKSKTNLDCNLKFGENIKDTNSKDKINLAVGAKHKDELNFEYTVKFDFPAKKVDVTITGDNMYKDKSVESNIMVQYHPERSVAFGVRLHNKTDLYPNYAGELSIKLPQNREMSFAGAFGKENDNKYVSNLEFEIIKGRRTRIDTMLKIATEKIYEIEVGVKLPELEPVRVRGSYIKEENGHSFEASYKKADNLYRIYTQGIYEPDRAAKFTFDVAVPSRRVMLILGGSSFDTERHVLFDIQWNADEDLSDRFLLNVSSDFKSWDDFEGAFKLYYPSRAIDFNMKHSSAARYITNIELAWSPKERMEFNIIFRDDEFNAADRTELTVVFTSPFEGFEELGFAGSLIRDSEQYQTKSSVTWAKKKKVLISATAKVPFDVNSIDIAGTLTTPFDGYKTMTALVKHRLSDGLQSNVLVQWGRNRFSLGTSGQLTYTKMSRSFEGKFDLRTPFEGMRSLVVNAAHKDDFKTFSSKITTETTQNSENSMDTYSIEMNAVHDNGLNGLSNQGTVKILIPNDDISAIWEVSRLRGSSRAMIDITPKRGNRFKFDFGETHQMVPNRKISSNFEFLIPTETLQELLISFSHEDKPGYVKTSGSVTKDNLEMMSASVDFENSYGTLKLESLIKSVYTEDIILELTSAHSIMPYNSKFELKWGETPYKVNAESRIFYNEFGTYDSSLEIFTPIPGFNMFKITSSRQRQGLNWQAITEVNVDRKKVSLGTAYRFDHVKLTTISIKSSFPQFPGLETSFRIDGNPVNFRGEADFTMRPYVGKISTDFSWAFYKGTSLTGTFNLNTPFRQYPYMKAKVNSNMMGMSRVSGFEIEYLPTQVVKVESDYRFTSLETLEGTVKVTSPYTENQEVVAGFTHVGNREEFTSKARITCKCFKKPVFTEATFSSKNGIISTFEMDSPFRGYETVKWNLNHTGEIDDFSTKAEYETNGQKISFENLFSMKKSIQYQLTLLTPFGNISRTHLQFSHKGKFPNTNTHAEVAYNEKSVVSDFDLKNNKRSTVLKGTVTTPFKRYEDIRLEITRRGSLSDLTAKAELQYDQTWHASLRHKFDGQDLVTSSILKSPYLPDDVMLSLNHTGVPLNFQTTLEYTLGPAYKTSGEAKFLYDLPNLTASAKTVTVIGEETRVNALALEHSYKNKDGKKIDISSKFLAQIREQKTNVEFKTKYDNDSVDDRLTMDILTYLIVESPHPDFSYSKLFYEANIKSKETAGDNEMESVAKFTFETPLLEKVLYTVEGKRSKQMHKQVASYAYGEYELYSEEIWQPGQYHYMHRNPVEGYEKTVLDVTYRGNLFDPEQMKNYPDLIDWNLEGTLTSTPLASPVKLMLKGDVDNTDAELKSIDNNVKVNYDSDKEVTADFTYKQDGSVLKVTTPYKGYESSEIEAVHFKKGMQRQYSMVVTSSALETPIKITTLTKFDPIRLDGTEISYNFTSGFTNFTHLELEAKIVKPDPYIKVLWEDDKKEEKEIYIEGPVWKYAVHSDNVEASAGMTIQTPFIAIQDMKVNFEHKHFTSPMRAKEVILVQYNGRKYLDVDAEVGALNKFSGSMVFLEPRQMEFSFSGVNEGESVNADLVLNWNKLDQDSKFRLEFGLADSGDKYKEKKVFDVRVTNPGRIVSLHNTFEKTDDKISSSGKVSWDEKEGKKVSYELDYSKLNVRGSELHSSDLKLTLPARSVEMSGSYTSKAGQVVSTGALMWDSGNDRDKQVQVKVTLSPTEIRKMAEVTVRLPSMNKELSLSTELAINEGSRLLDGQTKLTYSPEVNKAVLVKYIIQREDEQQSYRAGWSLDHVFTKTHVSMMSSLSSKDDVTVGDVEMKYRGTDKSMTALQLHSDLDISGRKMNIKISSPDESAELSGHMTSESPYILTVATSRNLKPTWKTVWTVNTEAKSLDASMTYNGFKEQVVTQAFFPNASSFVSETTTQKSSDIVQEGRLSAELQDRKLHAHLKWRPQLFSEAAEYGSAALQQVRIELSPVMENGMKDLGNLMLQKHRLISASLTEELKPVTDNLEEELKSVQQDLRKMRRDLKKMYRQNELYLRTIEETYSGSVKAMLAGYSTAITKLDVVYTKAQELMEEFSNKIDGYQFKERYNEMMNTISEKVQEGEIIIKEELEILFSVLTKKVEELTTLYDDTVKDISNELKTMIEVLLDELALDPYIDDVKSAYNKLIEIYPSLDNTEILKVINQVQQLLIESMEKSTFVEKYKTIYKRTEELLSEKFGEVMNNEDIQEMNKAILDLYEQVSWLYKYTEINISLRELLQKTLDTIRIRVMEEFNGLPLGLLDLHKSEIITFDLENGEIEFDLYLPIPMDDFNAVMRMTADKYMRKLKKLADKYFPRRDICLWDLYYRLPHVRWSMRKDWVPPFDVFGTVAGKQHFTTFDGHHYDVAGLCSYVLAQDVVNNNFTVALKYRGGPRTLAKESIVAMVAGKTVEMFQTYMVKIDGQPTELPYHSDKLTVVRSGNTVTLNSLLGLSVVSDFSNDYHIVGLSGWYFGKVGGLLGNIDYEQGNDLMTPDGHTEERTRKFLNSWEVDSSCRSTMAYTQREPRRKSEECAATFDTSSSSLRPCFLQVLPDMYQRSCNMEPSALCNLATLYVETCHRRGVTVTLPESCVQCKTHDAQKFSSVEDKRYEAYGDDKLQDSMDVVFVVEEGTCNHDVTSKLKDVIYRLEQSLTKSGTSGNRYSLFGYSGNMMHSHTMEGQLFNDATKFAMGLENLRFDNTNPYTDPLSALKLASSLPFRTAVKKTVILVSCSPCNKVKSYSFSRLSSALQTMDITLHVLRQNGFQLKTNRSPKSQIFGIDIDKAFIGQRREDGDIFSNLDIPQDYCSSLALNTNGSIFDSGHLFVGSVRQQRRFMDSFVERVQQKDSKCQVCSCELNQYGAPSSVCRRCDMQPLYYKPIPNVIQKAVEYKNIFSQKIESLLF